MPPLHIFLCPAFLSISPYLWESSTHQAMHQLTVITPPMSPGRPSDEVKRCFNLLSILFFYWHILHL